MSATSKIPSMPNVAFLGLLIFLCLYPDIGVCIPEPLVGTDPHVVIKVGTSGILPCRIQRQGYSVEWKRQLLSETELLVSFDPFYNVGARDGPGYEAGLFNMTDDYSLVIKYAKVQDEGLYMCSFSDYQTGKTFRNSTKVSVQALPQKPFPTIQECIVKGDENSNSSVCTLAINSTSNLTCLVERYYPDIDLFFLHGSENMTYIEYEEWNNEDSTKSKSKTIEISVSDEPYQCVASGLPGMVGNRSVSVFVLQARPQARSQGPHAAAIAVSVTVVVLGCLTVAVIVRYRRKRRGRCSRRDYLSLPVAMGMPLKVPKGPISKLELWELITKAKDNNAFEKLKEVLQRLGISEGLTSLKDLDFHESLCKWKSKTSKSNQRMVLYSVCCELGMTDIINEMTAFVMDAHHDVSSANIEHVLWDIGGPKAMIGLLKALKLDYKSVSEAIINERNEPEVTNMARTELHKWRNRKFDKNPLVILSLKLDNFQCKTNFFGTPKGPVSKLEMRKLMTAATENDAIKYLKEALRRLSNTNQDTLPDDFDFYESLCKWKSETSSINNQRDTLYSVCCDVGMADIIRKLIDFIMDTSCKHDEVSSANIEYILWEIRETGKIIQLLKALELDHEEVDTPGEQMRERVIDLARMELLSWRSSGLYLNPVVTLSLKLDDLGCETNLFKTLEGAISKPELWKLVMEANKSNDLSKLREACHRLRWMSGKATSKLEKDIEIYESLCKWKREMSSSPNQRKMVYSVCCDVGMANIIRKLIDFVMSNCDKVPQNDLKHVLWEIGDTQKITELLKALEVDHETVATASEKGRRKVIDAAREELQTWQDRQFDINPVVILCLKLDDVGCDTNFFQIPTSMKKEIDEKEMRDICCQISKQHFMYLVKAATDILGEELQYDVEKDIEKFVEENNKSLFHTLQMLHDWEQNEECSNYGKRNKVQEAVKAALQSNRTDASWPPDEELRVIASFLSPTSMEKLCSKLEIESPPIEGSEEERFHALIEWRDNHASSKDLKEKHNELFNAFKEIDQEGLIPRAKGQFVYKAELVDLAFHLLAQNLLPLTGALGISDANLNSYRPKFDPSHMTQGTIGLLCKLHESGQRSTFFTLLKQMSYPNSLASVTLALEITFEEVCAVSVDPANCQKPEQKVPAKSPHADHNTFVGMVGIRKETCMDEVSGISSEAYPIRGNATSNECLQQGSQNETANGLTLMLTSASKVKDHNAACPESTAFLKHFELWRERHRMIPFNFRLALASRFHPHQINDFLQGKCNKGIIPLSFIHKILEGTDPEQRLILGNLIIVAPFTPVAGRLSYFPFQVAEWSRLEAACKHIHAWTEQWIMQIIHTKMKTGDDGFLTTTEIAKEHRDFNDKLVDNGFIALAREIMISEQQLIDV